MIERDWRVDGPGHLWVSVPRDEAGDIERVWAVGRCVNLFAHERAGGWIQVTELRRTAERDGEVRYLLAFAPLSDGKTSRARLSRSVRLRAWSN